MIRRKTLSYNLNPMFAILIGTMLATLATHFFLSWVTMDMTQLDAISRLLLTTAGLAIYGGIIGSTFYLFLPVKPRQVKN
jgi:hypothetical protein